MEVQILVLLNLLTQNSTQMHLALAICHFCQPSSSQLNLAAGGQIRCCHNKTYESLLQSTQEIEIWLKCRAKTLLSSLYFSSGVRFLRQELETKLSAVKCILDNANCQVDISWPWPWFLVMSIVPTRQWCKLCNLNACVKTPNWSKRRQQVKRRWANCWLRQVRTQRRVIRT